MWVERIFGTPPEWMRREHPIMRYALAQERIRKIGWRWWMMIWLPVIALSVIGYASVSQFLQPGTLERSLSLGLYETFYWPTLLIQLVMQLGAMGFTMNAVGNEIRRGTWDTLRVTASGAALTMRVRWGIIFYQLRGALMLIILLRLVLLAAMLFDLTAFEGMYLNHLTRGITPELPAWLSVMLLSAAISASLVLPFTATGLGAALGILFSTFVRQRLYSVLFQITFSLARIMLFFGLWILVTQFRDDPLIYPNGLDGVIIFAFALLVDWGLGFLYLGYYGVVIWQEIAYGIFFGLIALLWALMQAALADLLLAWAARRVDRQ